MVPSGDEKSEEPASNRTIQVDALSDVQLVDSVESSTDEQVDSPAVSAPPPLPRKRPPMPMSRILGLTLLAIVAGGGLGFVAIHFLFPAPPPASVVAPTPTVAPPPSEPPRVRRVVLGDDEVIRVSAPASPPSSAPSP
jgi:hypothetical protein